MVSLVRQTSTPSAPFLRRGMAGKTPCCSTTASAALRASSCWSGHSRPSPLGSSPSALSASRTSRTPTSVACARPGGPSPQHRRACMGRRCGTAFGTAPARQRQHPACVGPMTGRIGDRLDTGGAPAVWTRPNRAAAPLAGTCRRSSCPRLLSEYFPWRRAIPIPTGRTLVVGHPLEPLARATLRAETQRGMVHRDQVRRRSRRVIRGHE